MPRQALALKKYRCGTGPSSSTSDNEHATAPLWNSEVLSIQHPVGPPIPELAQPSKEGREIPSSVTGKDSGHVLPNQPAGAISCNDRKVGEGEVPAWVSQAFAKARDTEGLAGGTSDENIDSCIWPFLESRHITVVRNIGVVVGKQR
jgi:hypothetical protein